MIILTEYTYRQPPYKDTPKKIMVNPAHIVYAVELHSKAFNAKGTNIYFVDGRMLTVSEPWEHLVSLIGPR